MRSALNKQELAAYRYTVRLLSGREYCAAELSRKMEQREIDQEIISLVLEQLKRDGYLSEHRFAEAYLRSRFRKGEAPWLAAQKARQKGVDHEALDQVLAEMTEDYDAESVCRNLLEQRDPTGLRFEEQRVWQRHARFLQNKGFETATILRVLKQR